MEHEALQPDEALDLEAQRAHEGDDQEAEQPAQHQIDWEVNAQVDARQAHQQAKQDGGHPRPPAVDVKGDQAPNCYAKLGVPRWNAKRTKFGGHCRP